MEFLSNENKYMLWSVLQESDVFKNIPDEHFNKVRTGFEKALIAFSEANDKTKDIVSMNKEVIPLLLSDVHTVANTNLSENYDKKIQVVYKADKPYRVEDIHKQRESEFNTKYQEQQTNMNSLLQPKIPKEVSFADTKEDKPLGGDMDKLIQDMLTSREKELEVISASSQNNIPDAKEWLKTTTTKESVSDEKKQTQITHKSPPEAKNIASMDIFPVSEITLEPSGITDYNTQDKKTFMDKFKKKDPMKDLIDEVKEVKQNQIEIMEKIIMITELLKKMQDVNE